MHMTYAVTLGAKKAVRSPGTAATDDCQLPCGCQDLNSGPVKKQTVPLAAEHISSSPLSYFFFKLKGILFYVYACVVV